MSASGLIQLSDRRVTKASTTLVASHLLPHQQARRSLATAYLTVMSLNYLNSYYRYTRLSHSTLTNVSSPKPDTIAKDRHVTKPSYQLHMDPQSFSTVSNNWASIFNMNISTHAQYHLPQELRRRYNV